MNLSSKREFLRRLLVWTSIYKTPLIINQVKYVQIKLIIFISKKLSALFEKAGGVANLKLWRDVMNNCEWKISLEIPPKSFALLEN